MDVIKTNKAEATTSLAKFSLGTVFVSPGAQLILSDDEIRSALRRHLVGDWGDVCEADRKENELSLKEGFRLMSVYYTRFRIKFWVITEADRETTTVLLPEDY